MTEIVVAITDPNRKRSPQLLENAVPVRHLLPPLVDRLQLPKSLNYELIPAISNQPISPEHSLAQARVAAGMELFLRPVRDRLLKMFLDELYDEIKGDLKDRLWDLAKDKLEKLFNFDPAYPDPDRLREAVGGREFVSGGGRAGGGQPAPAQARQPAPPKRSSSATCIILSVVVLGGALLVGGLIVGGILLLALLPTDGRVIPPPQPTQVILGTGDVQVTLRWNTDADIDLHVADPFGEEIWFQNRFADSGGQLDVDANADCETLMPAPVENVYWPIGGAPGGEYQVYVVYFVECDFSGPTDYEVTVKVNGETVNTLNGTLAEAGEQQFVTSFKR